MRLSVVHQCWLAASRAEEEVLRWRWAHFILINARKYIRRACGTTNLDVLSEKAPGWPTSVPQRQTLEFWSVRTASLCSTKAPAVCVAGIWAASATLPSYASFPAWKLCGLFLSPLPQPLPTNTSFPRPLPSSQPPVTCSQPPLTSRLP